MRPQHGVGVGGPAASRADDGDNDTRRNGDPASARRHNGVVPFELGDELDDNSSESHADDSSRDVERLLPHPSSSSSSSQKLPHDNAKLVHRGTASSSNHRGSDGHVLDEDDRALEDENDDDNSVRMGGDNLKIEQTLYPVEIGGPSSFTRFKEGTWMRAAHDWLYPPHLPPSCQLMRRENLAVPACYLLVGMLQGLSSPLVNVLPLDLGATEAQQTTISAIRSLPASFKLLFGFWSDNVPINGLRRKPYMLMGWVLASVSMYALMGMTNLNIPSRNAGCFGTKSSSSLGANSTTTNSTYPFSNATTGSGAAASAIPAPLPDDAPSVQFFSVALLSFGIGFWLADVMGDSIVAEKAKLEPIHARGSVQSSCYSYRFFGLMVSAPYSTYLYSTYGPHAVVRLLAFLPLAIVPLVVLLREPVLESVPSTRDQCLEIWNTVCSRSVWQPMGFVYWYNVMQVANSAWREYLVTVLSFTSCQLNLILIVAYVLLYLGIMCYKNFMITWSWRKVYVATTTLNGFFSLGQVLLIKDITFGLSPFLFALGDDAFSEFIAGVQFLPTTIMMVHLCPSGSEGASYAMFTTVNNAALTLSSMISTRLLNIWPVDKETLASGDLSGMLKLTYLTTALQVSAVLLVGLLPRYKEDLVALHESRSGSSIWGGACFLVVTFASILYAIGVGVANIVSPGGTGE